MAIHPSKFNPNNILNFIPLISDMTDLECSFNRFEKINVGMMRFLDLNLSLK
jgi:hypothetical protein